MSEASRERACTRSSPKKGLKPILISQSLPRSSQTYCNKVRMLLCISCGNLSAQPVNSNPHIQTLFLTGSPQMWREKVDGDHITLQGLADCLGVRIGVVKKSRAR